MARTKFSTLRDDVIAKSGASERIAVQRAEALEEMRLFELRHREAVSQAELAGRLDGYEAKEREDEPETIVVVSNGDIEHNRYRFSV